MNLGAVTAYADAVAAGYIGTREEFGRSQAEFAKNADAVAACLAESRALLAGATEEVRAEADGQIALVGAAGTEARASVIELADAKREEIGGLGSLLYEEQSLTESQRGRARANIAAGSAIVSRADGERVLIEDSAYQPLESLRILGRSSQKKTSGAQLFDIDSMLTSRAVAVSDSRFDSKSKSGSLANLDTVAGRSYRLSFEYYSVSASDSALVCAVMDGHDSDYSMQSALVAKLGTVARRWTSVSLTFKAISDAVSFVSEVDSFRRVMLTDVTDGDGGVVYEAYSGGVATPSMYNHGAIENVGDGGSVTLRVGGGNLMPYPYAVSDSTVNGVSVTVSDVGAITVAGKALADTSFGLTSPDVTLLLYPGEYLLSGGTPDVSLTLSASDDCTVYAVSSGNRVAFSVDRVTEVDVSIYIPAGKAVIAEIRPVLSVTEPSVELAPCAAQDPLVVELPRALRGIRVSSGGNYTDRDGNCWICDEIDLERGVLVERIGHVVLDGTEEWINGNAGAGTWYAYVTIGGYGAVRDNVSECTHLAFAAISSTNATPGYCVVNSLYGDARILFRPNGVSSLSGVTAWLRSQAESGTPVEVYYALTTPIETPLSSELLDRYRTLHSERGSTCVQNDAGACVSVGYAADTKLYIDRKLATLEARISAFGG